MGEFLITKSFQSTSRSTVGSEVFNQFVELLSSGVYKPGEKLPTEMEMCEQLQVSRPILREVIRALSYMGYLTSIQGGGIYVSEPTKPFTAELKLKLAFEKVQLVEVWELRYVLEVAIAGMAAERATDEEIEEILNSLRDYEINVKSGRNEHATILATQRFHYNVAKAAHNEALLNILENVSNLLSMSREVSIRVQGSSERALNFHTQIAQAIVARDAESAKNAMKQHLIDVKKDLEVSFEQLDITEKTYEI